MPHVRLVGCSRLQGDSAAEEGSAEFQVLPSRTKRLQRAGKVFCFVLFQKAKFKQENKELPLLPLCSLLYVCESYQYSVGFLSALILLDFVIFLKQGGLDITAK